MSLLLLKVSFLTLLFALAGACTNDKPSTSDAVDKEGIEDTEIVVEDFDGANDAQDDVDTSSIPTPGEDTSDVPPISNPESMPSKSTSAQQSVQPMNSIGTYYVSAKSADVKEQPNKSAKTLRTLSKGDRVQVSAADQNWVTLSIGGYVAASSVTTKAVGAERRGNQWRKGEPKK